MKKNQLILTIFIVLSFWSRSQNTMYATITGGDLYSVDVPQCVSRFIGSPGIGFGDIAMTPNGRLWGTFQNVLYEINTGNGQATVVGNFGLSNNSLVALNDSVLLTESNINLYAIRIPSASTYNLGQIGYGSCGDLSWYDNDLYMLACNQLIRITLNSTNSAIVNVTPVNSQSAPIPSGLGLITVPSINPFNFLVAFCSGDAYRLCQIDGTYSMLCQDILPNACTGSACLRLPVQSPIPQTCSMSGYENIKYRIAIGPNPFSDQVTIELPNYSSDINISIYNSAGMCVRELNHLIGKSIFIPRGELCSGVYSLRLVTGDTFQLVGKLIVMD